MRFLGSNATEMRRGPGLRLDPAWGAYSAPPDPLAGFEAATLQQVRKGEDGREEKDGRPGSGKG